MELFNPPYITRGPRPVITGAPTNITYATTFDVDTSDAAQIDSVVMLRPCAMTHHTDAGQRYIKLAIPSRNAASVTVQAPPDGNVAPPGHYMLFILNTDRVPSEATFVHVS